MEHGACKDGRELPVTECVHVPGMCQEAFIIISYPPANFMS